MTPSVNPYVIGLGSDSKDPHIKLKTDVNLGNPFSTGNCCLKVSLRSGPNRNVYVLTGSS